MRPRVLEGELQPVLPVDLGTFERVDQLLGPLGKLLAGQAHGRLDHLVLGQGCADGGERLAPQADEPDDRCRGYQSVAGEVQLGQNHAAVALAAQDRLRLLHPVRHIRLADRDPLDRHAELGADVFDRTGS